MGNIKEDLVAAKELIGTPEKWAKGGAWTYGKNCAATACNGYSNPSAMFDALRDALPLDFGRTGWVTDIFRYNDLPDTTHDDIMALFDRAIAAQEHLPSDE